mmetsp:Transcript_55626/g.118293  ORF Transcript_55626/g.118293 Transcript_55626/m.118293 type:complete len:205 (+) Transcript_55626:43-657(+)
MLPSLFLPPQESYTAMRPSTGFQLLGQPLTSYSAFLGLCRKSCFIPPSSSSGTAHTSGCNACSCTTGDTRKSFPCPARHVVRPLGAAPLTNLCMGGLFPIHPFVGCRSKTASWIQAVNDASAPPPITSLGMSTSRSNEGRTTKKSVWRRSMVLSFLLWLQLMTNAELSGSAMRLRNQRSSLMRTSGFTRITQSYSSKYPATTAS